MDLYNRIVLYLNGYSQFVKNLGGKDTGIYECLLTFNFAIGNIFHIQ